MYRTEPMAGAAHAAMGEPLNTRRLRARDSSTMLARHFGADAEPVDEIAEQVACTILPDWRDARWSLAATLSGACYFRPHADDAMRVAMPQGRRCLLGSDAAGLLITLLAVGVRTLPGPGGRHEASMELVANARDLAQHAGEHGESEELRSLLDSGSAALLMVGLSDWHRRMRQAGLDKRGLTSRF